MAQTIMPDILTDEEMTKLESSPMPDVLTDDEMAKFETPSHTPAPAPAPQPEMPSRYMANKWGSQPSQYMREKAEAAQPSLESTFGAGGTFGNPSDVQQPVSLPQMTPAIPSTTAQAIPPIIQPQPEKTTEQREIERREMAFGAAGEFGKPSDVVPPVKVETTPLEVDATKVSNNFKAFERDYATADVRDKIESLRLTNSDIVRSWESGNIQSSLDWMAAQAMLSPGGEDINKVFKLREEYAAAQEENPAKAKNWFTKAINSTITMMPEMAKGTAKTVAGSIVAPGVGTVAGASHWMLQGAGSIYADLREAGVSHETARNVALVGGALYGAVETVQVGKLMGFGQKQAIKKAVSGSVLNSMKKFGIEKAKDYAKEVGEEVVQQVIQDASRVIATKLEGINNQSAGEIAAELTKNALTTGKESLLPLLFIGAPATAIGAGQIKAKQKRIQPPTQGTIVAKPPTDMPQMPTIEGKQPPQYIDEAAARKEAEQALQAAPAPAPQITPAPTPQAAKPVATPEAIKQKYGTTIPSRKQVMADFGIQNREEAGKLIKEAFKPEAAKAPTEPSTPVSAPTAPAVPQAPEVPAQATPQSQVQPQAGEPTKAVTPETTAPTPTPKAAFSEPVRNHLTKALEGQGVAVDDIPANIADIESKLSPEQISAIDVLGSDAEAAYRDPLMGIRNRRWRDQNVENKKTVRVDIDKFKAINDTHGHTVGDQVLQEIGDILTRNMRGKAEVARYGGEEIDILYDSNIPDSDILRGIGAARRELYDKKFNDGKLTGVTFSAGAGKGLGNIGADEADAQLYKAKEGGRAQTWIGGKRYAQDEIRETQRREQELRGTDKGAAVSPGEPDASAGEQPEETEPAKPDKAAETAGLSEGEDEAAQASSVWLYEVDDDVDPANNEENRIAWAKDFYRDLRNDIFARADLTTTQKNQQWDYLRGVSLRDKNNQLIVLDRKVRGKLERIAEAFTESEEYKDYASELFGNDVPQSADDIINTAQSYYSPRATDALRKRSEQKQEKDENGIPLTDTGEPMFQRVEPMQRDIFGGEKPISEVDADEARAVERAAMKEKETDDGDRQAKVKAFAEEKGLAFQRGEQVSMFDEGEAKETGLDVPAVEAIRDAFDPQIAGIVKVVQSESDLPENRKRTIARHNASGQVRALYDPDTKQAYLIADMLPDRKAVEMAIAHEIYAHFGMRAKYGGAELIRVYQDIYKSLPSALKERIINTYFGKENPFDAKNPTHRFIVADEAIASEGETVIEQSLWDRLVAAVRAFLRKIGVVGKWTDNDIQDLLRSARTAARGRAMMRAGMKGAEADAVMQKDLAPADFYSPTIRTIETTVKQEKGVVPQIRSMLKSGQLKKAETEWIGLDQWLADNPQATKTDVLDWLREKQVRVEVMEFSEKPRSYKWSEEDTGETVLTIGGERFAKVFKKGDGYSVYFYSDKSIERGFDTVDRAREFALKESPVAVAKGKYGIAPKFTQYNPFKAKGRTRLVVWSTDDGNTWKATGETRGVEYVIERDDAGRTRVLADGDTLYTGNSLDGAKDVVDDTIRSEIEFDDRMEPTGRRAGPTGTNPREINLVMPGSENLDGISQRKYGKPYSDLTTTEKEDVRSKGRTEQYRVPSAHQYGNEADVNRIAHVRTWDVDYKGDKTLAVAEVQSDWNTALRKTSALREAVKNNPSKQVDYDFSQISLMPFEGRWDELAIKKAILLAANEGYDRIVFVNGAQTAALYDLSKQVDVVTAVLGDNGKYKITADDSFVGEFSGEQLPEVIGKGLAEKIVADLNTETPAHSYKGGDLKVEPLWANNLYDKRIPSILRDLIKKNKWNIELEKIDIGAENGPNLSMRVTPEMRESVQEQGLPLFQRKKKTVGKKSVLDQLLTPKEGYEEIEISDYPLKGFMLPDGRYLGVVGVSDEHRVINDLVTYPDDDDTAYGARTKKMFRIMEDANLVRFIPEANAFQFKADPTREQASAIARYVRENGKAEVEFSNGKSNTYTEENMYEFEEDIERGAPMFQKEPVELEGIDEIAPQIPAETKRDWFVRKVQDKMNRLKKIQETLAPNVPEELDTYLQQELIHGKTEYRLNQLDDKYVTPLINEINKANIPLERVEEYLYAKHAPERNAHIRKIRPEFAEEGIPGSGMSDEVAAEIIAKAKADGLTDKLEKIANIVYEMNDASIEARVEAGLIDEDLADAWREYDYYVPLRGIQEEKPATMKTGRGFDIRGKESKRALGRKSKAANLISHSLIQANEAIVRAEKNKVGQTFLKFVEANPNEDLWAVDEVKYAPTFNENTGEVEYRRDPRYQLADNVLSVKVDGKEKHITIKDEALARAMKNLGADKSNAVLQVLGAFNRYMSMINTSLVPEFAISNFMRDIQTAAINIAGMDMSTKEATKIATTIMKNASAAMKGVWQGSKGKSNKWADAYKEFVAEGGKIGFFGLKDVEQQQKEIVNRLAEMGLGKKTATIRMFRSVKNFVMNINEAVENSTRLATYQAMRDHGMSAAKAASVAKNITVNFNKKGEIGAAMNALYVFSNAGVQGTARLFKALKSPRVQKLVAGITAGSVAIALLNRLMAGDDDDGENYYDKVPDWEKQNNIIIMIPGTDGKRIKIPVPYGYNVFWALGQAIDKAIHNPDKAGEAAVGIAGSVANAFNPLGGELGPRPERIVQTFAPTFSRPVVDLAINENFFGAPIYKERDRGYGAPESASHQFFKSTSEVSKTVAKGLNEMTGGTKFQPGAVDINPDVMDYVVEYLTGGAGRTINQSVDLAAKAFTQKPIAIKEVPFVRRFIGEVDDYATEQAFWDNVEKLEAIQADYKFLRQTDQAKAEKFRQKNAKELSLPVKGYVNSTAAIRKTMRATKEAKQTEFLQKQLLGQYKKFNKTVKESK